MRKQTTWKYKATVETNFGGTAFKRAETIEDAKAKCLELAKTSAKGATVRMFAVDRQSGYATHLGYHQN